jgi:hypothetical protein
MDRRKAHMVVGKVLDMAERIDRSMDRRMDRSSSQLKQMLLSQM